MSIPIIDPDFAYLNAYTGAVADAYDQRDAAVDAEHQAATRLKHRQDDLQQAEDEYAIALADYALAQAAYEATLPTPAPEPVSTPVTSTAPDTATAAVAYQQPVQQTVAADEWVIDDQYFVQAEGRTNVKADKLSGKLPKTGDENALFALGAAATGLAATAVAVGSSFAGKPRRDD